MTRYLLLGASGFLGRHVGDRLDAETGAEVVTAGRRAPGGDRPHRPHLPVDLAEASVDRLAALLAEAAPDVVVNAAGAVTGPPAAMAAVNTTAVGALAAALLTATPSARLVHLGSAAEYGRVEPGEPVTEETPPRPVGVYGVTKLGATEILRLARRTGLDALVLRVFNPVGPGAPASSLLGRLVEQAESAEVRLGPLADHRDFVDARDVADAVLAAATAPSDRLAEGRSEGRWLFNVGSGRARTARELVRRFLEIVGSSASVREAEPGSDRSAHVPWQRADVSAAAEALGWRPRRDLDTTLVDVWAAACAR
ncbi:Nucleoside-diphosphate-sugar epimerase [Streptoalloteichus tenebrarius]|uniref:Nucleoside-diphosphate-sugar epimerase n=1 Tax=Streptoalloteichus tenebrarius (strain ATCC 17920 / DSM 40477 / JCM 4838 / CBS 697.72 / NBRC 16177 / NCIMB 11028 / NRRL B-12390 / A12253. 1 / ISP 5477) TaxID=1933 RepID=A0ABT1HQU3_STRSD|nr:NAD(P)-dependent oxidoreductase [Streptoalloteichus tenebrarius]MCP2257894.1 Nucleoside-diphosphate-sugar epimerase [Streptoalloteichus tenebrarius]BFE99743.1 NAD-dependent epimerase/dehydratase family protein [Streptoalloteichus tenebrarius]